MKEKAGLIQKVSFIVNPKAARKKWLRRKRLRTYLQKSLPGQIHGDLGEKENTIGLAKKLSQDRELIVAIGGDGTISDVLQGIFEGRKEKEVSLGIIPFGSGNAFRKSLHIPKKVRKAVSLLHKGELKEIDLIDIEGRVAGFMSIGATAKVTQKKIEGNIPGILGHLAAGRLLLTLREKEQEVELIDGIDDQGRHFEQKKLRLKFLDCVVAKTNYFGYSWKIAPKAKINDNYLDITFFEMSGLKYVLLLPLIYFGLFQRTQRHFKAKKIIIQGSELPVQYNGEFLGFRKKIEVKILPKAIKIICPKKAFKKN